MERPAAVLNQVLAAFIAWAGLFIVWAGPGYVTIAYAWPPPAPMCQLSDGDLRELRAPNAFISETQEPGLGFSDPSQIAFEPRDDCSGLHFSVARSLVEMQPDRRDLDAIGSGGLHCLFREILELQHSGAPERALELLGRLSEILPRLSDRFALLRGELQLQARQPISACESFAAAVSSPVSEIRMRGRVGAVRCRIASGDREAFSALEALLRRFPHLPEQLQLRYEFAESREAAGATDRAIALYRLLDLQHPGSAAARQSRNRIKVLEEQGFDIAPLPIRMQVERAETLLSRGPMSIAKADIVQLWGDDGAQLPDELRRRTALMMARIARLEGQFDAAVRFLSLGRSAPAATLEERMRRLDRARDMADAARGGDSGRAARRVSAIRRGRPPYRLTTAQLLKVIQISARGSLRETLHTALKALSRKNPSDRVRLEAAILASGVADDLDIVSLLEKAVSEGAGVNVHYHFGRALERLGRNLEAAEVYRTVERLDHSPERYYAMWAAQRGSLLRAQELPGFTSQTARPEADPIYDLPIHGMPVHGLVHRSPFTPYSGAFTAPNKPQLGRKAHGDSLGKTEHKRSTAWNLSKQKPTLVYAAIEALVPAVEPNEPTPRSLDWSALAAALDPIVESRGGAYPWWQRAQDLIRLRLGSEATQELHESYLAWRMARGRPLLRDGIEAISRGTERARANLKPEVRQARLAITEEERAVVAEIARSLGDEGTAQGFMRFQDLEQRPRAYEHIVDWAAEKHGVDPNLLLAVMRVESIYQRAVVSYAGAVGLMQIMPRTGINIAHSLGRRDFSVAQLLEPRTNIEFAAWYLASLIDRFEGRIPLAIASYNGGPHNVRRWIREYASSMPLDAFLERIPFEQTHRYVRRVLSHFAAYRAQRSLPMIELHLDLPELQPDDRVTY